MGLTLNCARCGHPLPPLTDDERKLFQAGAGAIAQHEPGQCPHELEQAAATAPARRHFEARTRIVEVFPDRQSHEVLAEFTATAVAPSAAAVMEAGGPLADQLGEKWMTAAKHIALADVPVDGPL